MNNKFTIYWRNGERSVVEGETIEDAFTKAGHGAGAMSAVDWYDNGDTETHHYDREKKEWVKNAEVEPVKKTRYNVGDVIYTIYFKNGEKPAHWGFSRMPYLYNQDKVAEITILPLTVTEHVKVSDGYSDEKKYDGFILKDKDGNVWHNQYPHASYGQLSDSEDRIFNRSFTEEELAGDKFIKLRDSGVIFESRLLTDAAHTVKRAIDDSVPVKELLSEVLTEIHQKLKDEYKLQLVEKPVWEKYPKITHYVLQPLD